MIKIHDIFVLLNTKRKHQEWIMANLKNEISFNDMVSFITAVISANDHANMGSDKEYDSFPYIELLDTVNAIIAIARVRDMNLIDV